MNTCMFVNKFKQVCGQRGQIVAMMLVREDSFPLVLCPLHIKKIAGNGVER